jgi:D-alanyl-D-alanine carboxypeptidase
LAKVTLAAAEAVIRAMRFFLAMRGPGRPMRRSRLLAFVATVVVVIAGCSTGLAPKHSALKTIDPARLQAVVEGQAKNLTVPGAVVLMRTPQGTFVASVGTTKIGAETPPTADTHFRIASNTKTMTAALIVRLAQDGRLKFSDPVSAYVQDVPNGTDITIAELLKMRTGLYG